MYLDRSATKWRDLYFFPTMNSLSEIEQIMQDTAMISLWQDDKLNSIFQSMHEWTLYPKHINIVKQELQDLFQTQNVIDDICVEILRRLWNTRRFHQRSKQSKWYSQNEYIETIEFTDNTRKIQKKIINYSAYNKL